MRVCVIDGRGGGIGSRLVAGLRPARGDRHELLALATNPVAAAAMAQSGATRVAVGQAAIAQAVRDVDVIVGSLSIVLGGAMLGEITPELARAVLDAPARKVLLPVNRSRVEVVGTDGGRLESLITCVVERVRGMLDIAPEV